MFLMSPAVLSGFVGLRLATYALSSRNKGAVSPPLKFALHWIY